MTHFMVGGELADGDEDIFTRENNRSIAVVTFGSVALQIISHRRGHPYFVDRRSIIKISVLSSPGHFCVPSYHAQQNQAKKTGNKRDRG